MNENNKTNRDKRIQARKQKQGLTPAFATAMILIIIAVAMLGVFLYYTFTPNREMILPANYYNYNEP
jgi:uncharacterized membrane protein YukC